MPSVVVRGAVLVAALAWAAFAFWLFSFSFSDGFFRYSLASRLPPFLCAFGAALVIPWSGVRQWLRARRGDASRLRAWFVHAVTAGLSLAPMMLVAALLARVPGPWKLSADDAMGVGISFLMLAAIAIVSALVLAVALALSRTAGKTP